MKKTRNTKKLNPQESKKTFGRLIRLLFNFYPVLLPVVIVCSIVSTIIAASPAIFMEKALTVIEATWQDGNWAAAQGPLLKITAVLIVLYVIGLIANLLSALLMVEVFEGAMMKIRNKLFSHMETLPIRFFDTNDFGDIMSHYTNDVDSLRQLIANSLPGIMTGTIGMLAVLGIMLYYSVWMTLVVIVGVVLMMAITGGLGGQASRFFRKQQSAIGKAEGFVEEAMTGAKTIKVFTHEQQTMKAFDEVNNELFLAARSANRYANVLAPVLFNLGDILYVVVALAGGAFLVYGIPNISFSGMALTIATVIPFLNMTKHFTGQIGQIARTINPLVMGLAGAKRIFDVIDLPSEVDEGYVSLVNVCAEDENVKECEENTGYWAWKSKTETALEYTPLKGEVVLDDIDFSYEENHPILKNISLYAKPGQKIAFVGATGAGKTTITNLLNRFYDVNNGSIRYDGIDITTIKKNDLRHCLGMVLQETNLFVGSVMDNIRFGNLQASDEECIEAAKLAGADSFICRLPQGYDTEIVDNGANLSQGQRQLLSIARAAVANPPVMILDEATSSIDTRTESLVQKGMDALMQNRTTFVIAHRLSTVRNANLICVLDHGRIIEKGNHTELIQQKGTYYQLYTGAFELE